MLIIPGTIYSPARFGNPAALVPVTAPAYVPRADGVAATLYSDFSAGNYWYNNSAYGSFSALLTALSGTFSRTSTAYYYNSSGVLTSAATGTLRFNYDPVTLAARGILIEGSRTNSILQSNGFSTTWNNVTSGTVLTSAAATSPDGTSDAWKFVPSTVNNGHNVQQGFTATAAAWTCSVYVKANGGQWFGIGFGVSGVANTDGVFFDLTNGVLGAAAAGRTGTITSIGNGWYRLTVTATLTAATNYMSLECHSSNAQSYVWTSAAGAEQFYVFGAQAELGAFPSSYIPTATTSATRAADSLTWPYSALTSGTIFAEADTRDVSAARYLAQLDDGTANNRVSLTFSASAAGAFDVLSGGVSQAALSNGTVAANTAKKLAGAFSANDFALVVAAGVAQTDASGSIPSFTTFRLGADSAGANHPYGHIKQLGLWNNLRASNSALQSLTT